MIWKKRGLFYLQCGVVENNTNRKIPIEKCGDCNNGGICPFSFVNAGDAMAVQMFTMVHERIEKKWTSPIQNWGNTVQQLAIRFEGRLELDLTVGDLRN